MSDSYLGPHPCVRCGNVVKCKDKNLCRSCSRLRYVSNPAVRRAFRRFQGKKRTGGLAAVIANRMAKAFAQRMFA